MLVLRSLRRPLYAERPMRVVRRLSLRTRPSSSGGEEHVVLAPPGRGNIGDQALVEAFAEAVHGRVLVIVRSPDDIDIPPALRHRMRVLALPALVYGSVVGARRDLRILSRSLQDAATFTVLGADIMDGAYVRRASVNRAGLAERFAELGWPSRVAGFSWNADPHRAAVRAMRRADAAGVRLLVRDPRSAARARADGLTVEDCADIVFCATTIDTAALDRHVPALGDAPLALVNASGLVGGRLEAYRRAVAMLRATGHTVVIVPHVSRPGADDLPLCRALAGLFAEDPAVRLVGGLLTPSEIRGLTARASITVTGRMHLAVMSLMAGVPAVTVATQGKVEGLMALFGVDELCVTTAADFDEELPRAVSRSIADRERLSASITAHLDQVRALSRVNVDGLEGDVTPRPSAVHEAGGIPA